MGSQSFNSLVYAKISPSFNHSNIQPLEKFISKRKLSFLWVIRTFPDPFRQNKMKKSENKFLAPSRDLFGTLYLGS